MKIRLIVKKNKVNIIPLIDIIFLMLVFFMLATNFSEHKELNFLSNSKKETINEANEDKIFVIKIIDNEYIIKGKKVLVNDIEENFLKKWASLSFKKVVVINDKKSKFQQLISIIDLINKYGIKNVNFSNEPS
jgi:biopolymer transport protein ExbD